MGVCDPGAPRTWDTKVFFCNPPSKIPAEIGDIFGKSLVYRFGKGEVMPKVKKYEDWQN